MSDRNPVSTNPATPFANAVQISVAVMRIAVGWHFVYEGLTKLVDPSWSSAGYLKSGTGPFAGFFHWLASSDTLLRVVDQLNIWGLILIGLGLTLGMLTRPAAIGGIVLLAQYYIAHPPLFAPVSFGEGSNLIVSKTLVELFALVVIATFPAASYGLDALLAARKAARRESAAATPPPKGPDRLLPAYLRPMPRRRLLASLMGVPFAGSLALAFLKKHGWSSIEAAQLTSRVNPDVFLASATVKSFHFSSKSDLKGSLPKANIGNLALSRMILGGNLIGGWAHARDLLYADKLIRAYHTREKIFETLYLAESCGVDTILTNPLLCDVINGYWRNGGKIQFISDCGGEDVLEMIQKSIDNGACACYIQGAIGDRLVREGNFDLIAEALELIRSNGLPAGIGGHELETVRASVERGLKPDFWMKTFHQRDYWSADLGGKAAFHGTGWRDNWWCEDADAVAEYMKDLKEPWIAYKILGAGAIDPETGFKHAFESGADFICVGMYDFQIVDDVNLAVATLDRGVARARPWCA